jgi:hypothetical protein
MAKVNMEDEDPEYGIVPGSKPEAEGSPKKNRGDAVKRGVFGRREVRTRGFDGFLWQVLGIGRSCK